MSAHAYIRVARGYARFTRFLTSHSPADKVFENNRSSDDEIFWSTPGQVTIPPSYLDTGMGEYFEGFGGCEGCMR